MRLKLKGVSAKDYIHSAKEKGLKRMDTVPGLKKFLAEATICFLGLFNL